MNFAENNRISHRQLYRQLCMAFLAPFLLCLPGRDRLLNGNGLAGLVLATVLLSFSVIFLVRLAPHYQDLGRITSSFQDSRDDTHKVVSKKGKYAGRSLRTAAGIVFLSYVLMTAAYLLSVLSDIIPRVVLEDVPVKWLLLFTALVCGFGTEKGLQRRGRMAEVSAGILLGSVLFMMLLSLGQADITVFTRPETFRLTGEKTAESAYLYLCAFSGLGLLPLALGEVEKTAGSWKPILLAILTVSGIMAGMLLLLPSVFGTGRLRAESYPILPLLSGTNLPGKLLARFDVLWLGFVLYGCFFSLGSLYHYGNQVAHLFYGKSPKSFWLPLISWALAVISINGYKAGDYYVSFLGLGYLPVLVVLQLLLLFVRKKRRFLKTAVSVGILGLTMLLGGCGGIDPEKRLYPLALGVDREAQEFLVSYGMPALPQATGQSAPRDQDDSTCLTFSGESFEQILEKYNHSQEKYLDLGHLQVLVLGPGLLQNHDWDLLLDYLKQEAAVGENAYVFYAEDPEEILRWQSESGTSVGEYLTGILENRTGMEKNTGVTLRQVYSRFYRDGELPELPEVHLEKKRVVISG